jgi:hypothetical protein
MILNAGLSLVRLGPNRALCKLSRWTSELRTLQQIDSLTGRRPDDVEYFEDGTLRPCNDTTS